MDGCRINTKEGFKNKIAKIIRSIAKQSRDLGSLTLLDFIKDTLEEIKKSPNSEEQRTLFKSALFDCYKPDSIFNTFLNERLALGLAFLLFNPSYDLKLAEDNTVSSTYEETAKASKILRLRNFLGTMFKDAPNSKLYFQRRVKNDMVEIFLVDRSGDNPRYFTSQEEINLNVREYKQKLLDKIFDYINNRPLTKIKLPGNYRQMYIKDKYTNNLKLIKSIIDSELSPEVINKSKGTLLDEYYETYRDSIKNQKELENALKFLEAYNAWIILLNFDTILEDTIGTVVSINSSSTYNKHTGDLKKYSIINKATNIWRNWTSTDDIADMAEVISDVTQMLVETSKMYSWQNNEPFQDKQLSFHDFNYGIGLIKRLADLHASANINLNNLQWNEGRKPSLETQRILLSILGFNRANKIFLKNADGSDSNIPQPPTLKSVIARINENPQRYLPVLFEIVCNTNLLNKVNEHLEEKIGSYEKNILWSLYKEIFGGQDSPRSLYRLHNLSETDNVYQILTQVAASTFPEDYLQYYEKHDNSIGTRLLKDYAIDEVRRSIYGNLRQTSFAFNPSLYSKYGITVESRLVNNYTVLGNIKISIPINSADSNKKFNFLLGFNGSYMQPLNYTPEQYEMIWNDAAFKNLIKDFLGINFSNDPDFKSAYLEINSNNAALAVLDLSNILVNAVFNSAVNNIYLPRQKNINEISNFKNFIKNQYGDSEAPKFMDGQTFKTEMIHIIPADKRIGFLGKLAMAKAITNNLLSQALSKTGEGTSLANYVLSRMRNFYHNLIEMQCKKERSAVRNLDFVVNANGLFEGILTRREMKTNQTNQQTTKFSDQQSFLVSFISDFLSAFIPNPDDNDFFKNGKVSFLPTVNSDKPQIDGLQVNLYAESGIKDINGKYKRFIELTDSEIELEMIRLFKPMYNRIVENINIELIKVLDLLKSKGIKVSNIKNVGSKIFSNLVLLNDINKAFKDNAELGKTAKDRITNGLHDLLTEYNKTHSRNPIALAQLVHYVFNKEGLLTNNNVLAALHGRFNSDSELSVEEQEYFKSLYSNESNYLNFLERNELTNPSNSESFFKWLNHLTVKDLLRMNFKVYLRGSDTKVRHNSKEIQFLRGEASFSKDLLSDPKFKYLIDLNNEMKNWINEDGLMVIARGVVDGEIVDITNEDLLNLATNLQLHPMLSKLNRLDYLCTQQYVVSTVGSHYVHSGKADPGYVLIEEAKRWLASNKRNVAATSTVHLFQNKLLNGSPAKYNLAIMEDVVADLYTIMGDLYLEGHKPLDGGMFVNGFISDLENNSLAGEAAGSDKKHFGTFYHENYAAGGIIKTAGFAVTNDRMRREEAWQNLQKAMSSRPWVKEYPGEDGVDIPEVRDITKDYLNRSIAYKDVVKDRKIMYQRVAHDNPDELATYELYDITYLGNNLYIIREIEIDEYGNPVTGDIITRSEPVLDINTDRNGYDLRSGSFDEDGNPLQSTLITINNNWDLFNKVFGGCYSLELGDDGKLTYSENSIRLMVHAINNVGYRKGHNLPKLEAQRMSDELSKYINTLDSGLDLDDIWLPLKHSDIHFVPNIGAIKSLLFNVNPDGEAVLEGKETLNFFQIRLALLGILLDKEHHADAADVSMPTQIILALANKSYTSEYAKEVYTALSTLTRQATKEFLKGVLDIITSNDPAKLTEEVTKLILDNILSKKEEESSVDVILADLIEKASQGKEIKYAEDIKGKFPWSDPTINSKLFSTLSTTLTNLAVKMRYSGSLSVICPTEKVESLRGDRLFSSFTKIYNEGGQKGKPATRTTRSDINLLNYQKSVYDGNEVDSDGKNMLVFDISRDMITFPKKEENESNAEYQDRIRKDFIKKRLSKTSELKTLHNYIIEFVDGTTEKVSINSPETYYYIKNLVVNGRKSDKLLGLTDPISYEELLIDAELKISLVDLSNDPKVIIAGYLSNAVLTLESVIKETGIGRGDIKKLFGLFKSKANGGVSVNKLAHQIWEDNSSIFSSDLDVKDLIIELIGEASTTAHFKSYEKVRIKEMAKEAADKEYESYQQYILDTYKMDATLYEYYYNKLSELLVPVRKIYENVIDKRPLGAYNVRFSDKLGNRYLIFDLDSINLLFKLNNLRSDKSIKGYTKFNELPPEKQQEILNLIFNSRIFREFSGNAAWSRLLKKFTNLPDTFNNNFVENCNKLYPELISEFALELYRITKPRIFNLMLSDLFKLSDNYKGKDRQISVNGELIDPVDIESLAYELIMPKVYKTQFGLLEFDDLQEILRDKDFFVKRGIKRFACKLDHQYYDYELKNFNGDHIYVLDKSKGIPEDVALSISTLHWDTKGKKIFRTDSQGKPIHELSSSKDDIAEINGVTVILTDNPLFYVLNFNYNTLKVSPNRVTEESYLKLIEVLSLSKRKNSKNYLKAISKKEGEYLNIDEFKEFNRKLDSITYVTIKADISPKDLPAIEKSVALICRIILKNGRELHTSFNASLDLIAGRIPAQSQQSFMTLRVVAFDNSDINTAMVSTFLLFLLGSDLDIDAVTLLGYEFDKNGKFIGWSPYFDIEHSDNLEASKKMPLPTGELREITFEKDRKTTNGEITAEAIPNFFELYNKYFGTLFNTIKNEKTGGIITENKIPKLQLLDSTPEGLELLAQFLRDFNQYGINIKADIDENEKIVATKDFFKRITRLEKINETTGLKEVVPVEQEWNLFADPPFGLGIGYNQAYGIAKQLLDIANTHNDYLNTADEYLRDGMSRNYSVHYMYKSAAAACNQTEAMISVDVPTDILRGEAGKSIMAEDSDNYAPGRVSAKVRSVGEGLAGKDGVGIGAVGIKANSTTQFYISELLNYGSDSDKEKVLFRKPKRIGGKEYWGFDNMYTGREVSDHERIRFQKVWDYIDTLTSEDQVTNNVAINIAAMLSVSVDNAKDLVLAKINSGPRLMGLYIYGMTLGVPIETLSEIMRSEEGMILKEMTEGSLFNNDISSFKVLDVFKKLDGNIFGELQQYSMVAENSSEYPVKIDTELTVNEKYLENIGSTVDILFSAMYPAYIKWFNDNQEFLDRRLLPASDLNTMIRHLFSVPRKIGNFDSTFEYVYDQAKDRLSLLSENIKSLSTEESYKNWDASMKLMVMLITDIAKKSRIMLQGRGKDLKTLAEGAEEMRILGSILSINKGLKTTFADAETFIDTIENLIYDRKKAMGDNPLNSDKIDFHKFFTDMEYLNSVIEAYEKIKHSVNIPHLISKVPHFKGYLQTQMLPTITFITNSVKFRALHKYRNNVNADNDSDNPLTLFNMFEVDGKKDKQQIIKGLENLIHFKLFARWAYDNDLLFQVPKGFKYFTNKETLASNPNGPTTIKLYTEAGLATFKKYMEEIYIPALKESPYNDFNEFVKNLQPRELDNTPIHSTIVAYSLPGDLMARKGRQAELNAKMFGDFSRLSGIKFQTNDVTNIPSLIDAFYIYSLYCFMGKKGLGSLMNAFDYVRSKHDLRSSFLRHIAKMDVNGNISASKEELIVWCAPTGTLYSKSKYAYVTSPITTGVLLKLRINENAKLTEDEIEQRELAKEAELEARDSGERVAKHVKEKYGIYKKEYLTSQYNRLTKNNFLIPSTPNRIAFSISMPVKINGVSGEAELYIRADQIQTFKLPFTLKDQINSDIEQGIISKEKYSSADDFESLLEALLKTIHIPYKASLLTRSKLDIDFGVIQNIIDQKLNC